MISIKKYLYAFTLGLLSYGPVFSQQTAKSPYEADITRLMSKMTLQQKVGQMAQITLDVIGKGDNIYSSKFPFQLDEKMMKVVFEDNKIGSILNSPTNTPLTPSQWQTVMAAIQKASQKYTGIPCIYGVDAIHGTTYTVGATFLPQQIALGATFNTQLAYEGARLAAYETKASNIPWNFSPVLDMGRDPRWPRLWETFGEDPYLITRMGAAVVKGYQGDDKNHIGKNNVAACLKHYVGYGATFTGKDREPGFISEMELFERHLRPFQQAVKNGALSVMVNSGIINGISVHSNKHLLTEILKDRFGFDGVLVSDWGDINNLYRRDKIASSDEEAIMLAVNAGVDMSMIPYDVDFCRYLIKLVNDGKVSMNRIDDAVRRILRMKYRLGLFNKPNWSYKDYPDFGSSAHITTAKKAAQEAITLLKNANAVLPLRKNARILVTGPNANSMRTLNGGWTLSWQGEKADKYEVRHNTILQAIINKVRKEHVVFAEGVSYNFEGKYYSEKEPDINAAVKAAQNADVIVACVGENTYTEKPGDLDDLYLSDNQQDLVKALAKTGKPVILVLNEGRPRIISKIEPLVAGVIQTYLPGSFGGEALADVLFGEVNPSGKLPYTYPRFPNSLMTYDYKPAQNQERMAGAYDYESTQSIQYPFGYGLSYTKFEYTNLKVNKSAFGSKDELVVTVDVKNTGSMKGKETVIMFVSDLVASVTPDVKRVRGFEKIELAPNETKTVSFSLHPSELSFADATGKMILEPGEFEISIQNLKTKIRYL